VPTREEWAVVLFTLRVAALGTAMILPFGVAAAALLARRHGPGRTLLDTLFSLPLVLPPTAVGVVLLDAFARVSPLGLARTLGCGPVQAFFRVTLPLAWRGVLAGTVLAFARALGEFGATVMLAGNIPGRTQTLALAIFHEAQLGHDDRARVLAGVTAVLAFAALWSAEIVGRARARRTA
jgi:molybdate transport system permease protein